jgi:hypothetical protein
MATILEYLNMTVPDVVKKKSQAFFNEDQFFDKMRTSGKVKRMGGTEVRINRIKSGHSDHVEVNSLNIEVPLVKKPTISTMTGNWTRWIKPIIVPHIDINRMQSKDAKKTYIDDLTSAALTSFQNSAYRRLYAGTASGMLGLSTLNGGNTSGTSSGFANGALQFSVPASQTSTYLNETRTVDSTNFEDNWFNQYVAHNGIGTDFLQTAAEIKITADGYADTGGGILCGVCSITEHVSIDDEVRAYGGGTAIHYTPDDLTAGKAHRVIVKAGGIEYYSNRFMTASAVGKIEPVYLLNPDYCEWWVNADEDFRVSKFTDHMEHGNQDADVAFIYVEAQFAITNLLTQGCTDNP